MIVLRGPSGTHGACGECGFDGYRQGETGFNEEMVYNIRIGDKDITLCLNCYRKLSNILVYDFDLGHGVGKWEIRRIEK